MACLNVTTLGSLASVHDLLRLFMQNVGQVLHRQLSGAQTA